MKLVVVSAALVYHEYASASEIVCLTNLGIHGGGTVRTQTGRQIAVGNVAEVPVSVGQAAMIIRREWMGDALTEDRSLKRPRHATR
jgi:hypothetical protein